MTPVFPWLTSLFVLIVKSGGFSVAVSVVLTGID